MASSALAAYAGDKCVCTEPTTPTEPANSISSGPGPLPPPDASVILLLAAKAKGDPELEAQLLRSTLLNLDPLFTPAGEPSSVSFLILRFHQQLQEQHGLEVDPEIYDEARNSSWSFEKNWGVRFTESYIARKTLELLCAKRSDLNSKPFPFRRLPPEVRQEVFQYLLAGDCRRIMVSSLDAFLHEPRCSWRDIQHKSHPIWKNPSLKFRSARVGRGMGIDTAILRTSRAIHKEAEAFLYQLHEFDSYIGVFAVVPFLRSISHKARQNISCLTMYLHYLNGPVNGDFGPLGLQALFQENLTDWGPACAYIAQHVRLREFAFHMQFEACEDFQHLSWVQAMAQIKGLRKLTYYNCNDAYYTEVPAKLGPEDQDRLTTGVSVRNQALLSYLRSQMLAPTATRC